MSQESQDFMWLGNGTSEEKLFWRLVAALSVHGD